MKRGIALLLALCLLLTVVPAEAFADAGQEDAVLLTEETESWTEESEAAEETASEEPDLPEPSEETMTEETAPAEEPVLPEETEPSSEEVPEEETEASSEEAPEEETELLMDAPEAVPDEEDGEWEIVERIEVPDELLSADGTVPEDLLTAYLHQQERSGDAVPENSYAAKNFSGLRLKMYELCSKMVREVAEGERTGTVVEYPLKSTGFENTVWTAKELGISTLKDANGYITLETTKAIAEKINYSGNDIYNAIYVDLGPQTFWRGTYVSVSTAFSSYYIVKKNGQQGIKPAGPLRIAFSVCDAFQKPGKEQYSYEVDPAKLGKVNTAKNNALGYVRDASKLSDYNKLKYYRDVICDLTYHMGDAADVLKEQNDYSPWGFINVFDGDPDTNVVCGGYAVSYQYICELTDFDGDIRVYSILGDVVPGGYHMWNNVRMDDGKVYVVDTAWCDGGDDAQREDWFLAAIVDGSFDKSYYYLGIRSERTYADHMYRVYTEEELTVSDTEYALPMTAPRSGTVGSAQWTLDASGCLTVSGQLPQFASASEVPWKPWALSIRRAVIAEGTSAIPAYAFSGCKCLQEIVLPQSLRSIGEYAFYDCRSLKELTIPDAVSAIGSYAFRNCLRLQTLHLPNALKKLEFGTFWYCGSLGSVEIPAAVTDVANSFWKCSLLRSLVFLGSAPRFGNNAFQGNALTIYYPENDAAWRAAAGQNYEGTIVWKTMKNWTYCGDALTWTLSGGILTISGTGSMYSYASEDAPWTASQVRELRLEEGVTSLGAGALRNAAKLTQMTLPASLTRLESEAFSGCTALTQISLPGTVAWIGSGTFGGCTALRKVYFEAAAPVLNADAFRGTTATVYYKGDQYYWGGVADQDYGGKLTWVNQDYRPDYNVVYDANGGSGAPAAQKKLRDKPLTLSTARPTRIGYTFCGWAFSPAGEAVYQPGTVYTLNQDLALYAVWSLTEYPIVYQLNGGTNHPENPDFYTFQSPRICLQAPVRSGYTFTGWYRDSGLINAAAAIETGSIGALKLYAGWRENVYTVRFDGNGAESGTMKELSNRKYSAKFTLTASAFRHTGYSFLSWNTEPDGSGMTIANKASVCSLCPEDGGAVTLYAQWKPNAYTVTFSGNGGSFVPEGKTGAASTYAQNGTYDMPMPLEAVRFARTGYTFLGWNTKASGKGTWYRDGETVSNLTAAVKGKVTLYAQWEANHYTVRFDLNGAQGIHPDLAMTYAKAVTLPKLTVRRFGSRFAGWYCPETGKTYKDKASVRNLTAQPDGAVTLLAQWVENTYTVNFSLNGGSSGGAAFAKQTGRSNAAPVQLPAAAPVRAGYVFCGWSLKSDGSGTLLQPGTEAFLDAAQNRQTITLYAAWCYSVTFVNLSGSEPVQIPAEHFYNETFLAENPGFVRNGYTFAGWNTNASKAVAGTVQYKPTAKLKNLKPGQVLYAVWKAVR